MDNEMNNLGQNLLDNRLGLDNVHRQANAPVPPSYCNPAFGAASGAAPQPPPNTDLYASPSVAVGQETHVTPTVHVSGVVGPNEALIPVASGFRAACQVQRLQCAQMLHNALPAPASVPIAAAPDEVVINDRMLLSYLEIKSLSDGSILRSEAINASMHWTNKRMLICRSYHVDASDSVLDPQSQKDMGSAFFGGGTASATVMAMKQTKFTYLSLAYSSMTNLRVDTAVGASAASTVTLSRRTWCLAVALVVLVVGVATGVGIIVPFQNAGSNPSPPPVNYNPYNPNNPYSYNNNPSPPAFSPSTALGVGIGIIAAAVIGSIVAVCAYCLWRKVSASPVSLMQDNKKAIAITMVDPCTMQPAVMTLTLQKLAELPGSPHSEEALARWLQGLLVVAPHFADGSRDLSIVPVVAFNRTMAV